VTLVTFAQAQLASALVLLAPGVPLLFMGDEYGDPAPFPYFIDHGDLALTEAVRAGRARELAGLPQSGEMLDPAADATFRAARLDRSLRHQGTHRAQWALHRALIDLRRANPALHRAPRAAARAQADGRLLTMVRSHPDDVVVALFNVSAEPVEAVLPAVPPGWAGDESALWTKVVEAAAPEFGGSGELLPAARRPGEGTRLGPWEFCVYHLARAGAQ
jgi:maltooligosyltrehalose trehalohydrolase